MKKVKIYTTPFCPFCIRIKDLMKKKQTSFQEIDLSINPEKFEEMFAKTKEPEQFPKCL